MAQVNFIPNDPLTVNGPPMRRIQALLMPTGNAARVAVQPSAPGGLFTPHTQEFDFWQVQTSLIRGLRTWRNLQGSYLPRWFGNRQTLAVLTNAGDDLNAFYDRDSLQFFSHTFGGKTVHSGESEDIAIHELGHAILDAVRPDFFEVPFVEAGAVHEAFGDCWAVLTSLQDAGVRRALLQLSPDLGSHQFVSQLAEELGDAIRREFGAQHVEPGALRRALNTFRWADPATLPANAPAAQLSREVHSFSRVFTGCFYDTIRNIFNAGSHTSTGLRRASLTAGRLLLAALQTVPATARLFEGVGRRMLQADITDNASANAAHIRAAFSAHGITLGAPATSLPVPMERGKAAATQRALLRRLAAPRGAKLSITPVASGLHGDIAHVAAYQALALSGAGLKGLSIMVPAVLRVETKGKSIVGTIGEAVPVARDAEVDAQAFAQALVANGDLDTGRGMARRGRLRPPSHAVKTVRGRRVIVRLGFACGPPRLS